MWASVPAGSDRFGRLSPAMASPPTPTYREAQPRNATDDSPGGRETGDLVMSKRLAIPALAALAVCALLLAAYVGRASGWYPFPAAAARAALPGANPAPPLTAIDKARLTPASQPPPALGERRYSGVGATVSPPPLGAVARIKATDALTTVLSTDPTRAFHTTTSAPTVELAEYENGLGVEQPDGSMMPSVSRQLAWVVTFHGVPTGPVAPPVGYSPRPDPAGFSCDYVVAVSADTGTRLDSFRYCR